jgi:hypothetical protein
MNDVFILKWPSFLAQILSAVLLLGTATGAGAELGADLFVCLIILLMPDDYSFCSV